MSSHAAEQVAVDPSAPPSARPAVAAPAGSPVWRRGPGLVDDARAVLAAVDRLTTEVRSADDAHRRDPDEQWLRERLEGSVIGARTVTGELLGQVEQLEQYALSHRRWDLATRLRAVAGARSVDAMALVRAAGEPSQVQVEAAARVERALAGLRPDADEIEHGFEDLRGALRVLQRALRDVLGHRVDRPLSLRHLRLLLDGSFRVLSTAAVGLLGVLALATRDGAAHGDAALAAATATAAPVDGLAELVRRRLQCQIPEQRLLAAHDDLTYLVGDFAHAAAHGADAARLEELYAGRRCRERARGPLVAAGGLDGQARLRGDRPAGAGGARRGDAGGPGRRPGPAWPRPPTRSARCTRRSAAIASRTHLADPRGRRPSPGTSRRCADPSRSRAAGSTARSADRPSISLG